MLKKILLVLLLLAAVGLLAIALLVRKLPDLVVQNIRQTLGRDVTIGSLRIHYPSQIEMNRLVVKENAPFQGEVALFVERANLSVDTWAFLTTKKILFTDVELVRPRLIFRKSQGKMYHAFRIRPGVDPTDAQTRAGGPASASPENTGSADANQNTALPARAGSIPPLNFDHITIHDGEVQLMDYDADVRGFVITLMRMSAKLGNLALPSDGGRVTFAIEGLLDQGRGISPGRMKLSGNWLREELDGKANLELTGILLSYFEPYYRAVTPSRISDGELDIVASSESIRGTLMANSKWTLRRLAFETSESGDELFGFDANVIRSILTGDSGNLSLDLALNMDLRDRTIPFRTHLRKSLRQSIQATFLSNFDEVIKKTVNQASSEGTDLLKKQNWKDLLKKNKLDDIVNQVMNPQ